MRGAALTLTVCLVTLLSVSSSVAQDQTRPDQKANLEVLAVNLDPVGEGKNILHVTVKNDAKTDQVFGIHIQTRAGRAGWGTQFTETVKAQSTERIRFAYRFRKPVGSDGYLRLQFYNPDSDGIFDFNTWFRRIVYQGNDLKLRPVEVEKTDYPAASREEADHVIAVFKEFQGDIKNQDFTKAWTLCTRDYLQADQIAALTQWWKSTDDIEPEDVLPWDVYELVELKPESVVSKGKVLCLKASYQGQTWTIDFVRLDGRWKIDSLGGYSHERSRDQWKERLLPRLEKRSTKHFDIYYYKDSTAQREIDQIAETKERGYQEICRFLGKDSDVRICMVLFETEGKKRIKTGHQGAGWAFDHTIVEVYNEKQRLDPYHETVHILMGPYGDPPALFNEGFAVYMSEKLGAPSLQELGGGGSSIYARVRKLKDNDDLIEGALNDPDNDSILRACLTNPTETQFKTLELPDLQDRLDKLQRGGLIEKSGASYALAFPAVVGAKRIRLQRETEQTAKQLLPMAEEMVEMIGGCLKNRREMLYHVLWSRVMDGPMAWNAARSEMFRQVEAGDVSMEDKAWLIYPEHQAIVGLLRHFTYSICYRICSLTAYNPNKI